MAEMSYNELCLIKIMSESDLSYIDQNEQAVCVHDSSATVAAVFMNN